MIGCFFLLMKSFQFTLDPLHEQEVMQWWNFCSVNQQQLDSNRSALQDGRGWIRSLFFCSRDLWGTFTFGMEQRPLYILQPFSPQLLGHGLLDASSLCVPLVSHCFMTSTLLRFYTTFAARHGDKVQHSGSYWNRGAFSLAILFVRSNEFDW